MVLILYKFAKFLTFYCRKLSRFVSPAESQELLKKAGNLVNLNLMHVQRPDLQKDKKNQVGFLLGTVNILGQ